MKPLQIAHLYANKQNLGDWGSAEGIKQLLREQRSDIEFVDFFLSYHDLSSEDIQTINTECDLVVIGGGGLLYPRSKGLLLRLSTEKLSQIKKPIVLYAIGINYEPQDEHLVPEYLDRFSQASHLFQHISVRDTLTQTLLKARNIHAEIVPCPSVFLPKSEATFLPPTTLQKKRIGIVPVPLVRFETTQRETYLKTLTTFIHNQQNQFDFFLIGHSNVVDPVYETFSSFTPLPLLCPVNPWQLMEIYQEMDFLLGSRGHMGIFAVGAKKPFLFLSYNVKCEGFVDLLSAPTSLSLKTNTLNIEHLFETFQQIDEQKMNIIHGFENTLLVFKQQNSDFAKTILKEYIHNHL